MKVSLKSLMNNCLFDAVLESIEIDPKLTSQELRDICNDEIRKEGIFPVIPDGKPAGEWYLQILSRVTNLKINVQKDGKIIQIADKSVDDTAKEITIIHLGSKLAGHWSSIY